MNPLTPVISRPKGGCSGKVQYPSHRRENLILVYNADELRNQRGIRTVLKILHDASSLNSYFHQEFILDPRPYSLWWPGSDSLRPIRSDTDLSSPTPANTCVKDLSVRYILNCFWTEKKPKVSLLLLQRGILMGRTKRHRK